MRSFFTIIIFCFLTVFLPSKAEAQLYEIGMHAGYNVSRITAKEGQISNELFVSTGKAFNGGSFGIQFMAGPPRDQNVSFFKIIPSVLFEANLCRCGGFVNLITTLPDNSKSLSELEYVFYQGNYSAKFVAKMKNIQFLIGPTVSNQFFSGVRFSNSDDYRTADDQFTDLVIGYEFGMGLQFGPITLSGRYQNYITNFGAETSLFPTEYGNYQVKFMLAYFFISKHKGANWNSIYWE